MQAMAEIEREPYQLWECYCQTSQVQYVRGGDYFETRHLYVGGYFVQVFNLWENHQWEIDIDWQVIVVMEGQVDLQQSAEELWEWVQMCCWMG